MSENPLSPDLRKTKMGKEEPADVEMKDAESPATNNEEPKKDADLLTLEGKNANNKSFMPNILSKRSAQSICHIVFVTLCKFEGERPSV